MKKKMILTLYRIIMLVLTVIYSSVMTGLAGAGLIYNAESYGREIAVIGVMLILSGVLMTAGTVSCLFDRKALNAVGIICTVIGFCICMAMLYRLCGHADSAGWSDNYTMEAVSGMYKRRIIPTAIPSAMAITGNIMRVRKA